MTRKEIKEEQQLQELKELQQLQKGGEVPMRKGNIDSSVEIPAHEYDRYVVVRTLQRNLNPDQKSFTDIIKNVKVHAERFDAMVDAGGFVTFDDVKIVHDPRETKREKYEFRPVSVTERALRAAATSATPAQSAKAIKELEKKSEALASRETSLSQKEQEVTDRMNELAAKEKELAERELALKSAPPAQEVVKTPDPAPEVKEETKSSAKEKNK